MANTCAALLIGGLGTRLRSVVSDKPKALAPIQGRPFLYYVLKSLKEAGITEVALLTGYMHEAVVDAIGQDAGLGLNIHYSREKEPLGTAGALKNAEKLLKTYDRFLVLNGDTYYDQAVLDFAQTSIPESSLGMIGIHQVDDATRYGSIVFDHQNRIEAFKEKTQAQGAAWVNAGIYQFKPELLHEIPGHRFVSLENETLPLLIRSGFELTVQPITGSFVDIGIPESYHDFNTQMKEHRSE